jgi:hypothetical protein
MKLAAIAASALLIFTVNAFAGERIVVDPLEKPTGKPGAGVKKSEQVTVTGPLRIVAMQGAILTLSSTNYGQVILFSPMDVEASTEQKLRALESSGVSVKATGTLNTVCSESQLKAETMGCRRFDLTKQIVIEKP